MIGRIFSVVRLLHRGLMIIYGLMGNYGVASIIGPYAGGTPPTDGGTS